MGLLKSKKVLNGTVSYGLIQSNLKPVQRERLIGYRKMPLLLLGQLHSKKHALPLPWDYHLLN